MATVLENYYGIRRELEQRITQNPVTAASMWCYGEILYRTGVLETCQMYLRTAPISIETTALLGHYQMLDAYVQSLARERRYGPDRGPDTKKEREAAQHNLGASFKITGNGLRAFIQHRRKHTEMRSTALLPHCSRPGCSIAILSYM